MDDDIVIVLDPVNRAVIDRAIAGGAATTSAATAR